MSQKILGLDLGTSSIGVALRNVDLGDNLKDQLEYFSTDIFKSGVGINKSGEYSLAAERTKNRQTRKRYDTIRCRKWATLELLLQYDLCPISIDSLEKWKTYDKKRGHKREYPINDTAFEAWIKLDFNGDGKPDYKSPYQLRCELVTEQKDFTKKEERMKLGRALYHIAQRRGFKSSKGETIKDAEDNKEIDDVAQEMKKSEIKLSSTLNEYMEKQNLHTIGEAFAKLEDSGIRIRNSIYKAVRSQYEDEIRYMFSFQNGLDENGELLKRLISTKKGEGTIFYKNPLKSQKGLVGKCTLERTKPRCPISHPEYEKFRALSFINNIRYRFSSEEEMMPLAEDIKKKIYQALFTGRIKPYFEFKEIRLFLEKELGVKLNGDWEKQDRTINFKDKQNVEACPVTARLIKLLGEDWKQFQQKGNKKRVKYGSEPQITHIVSYDAMDIWHICFNADDPEDLFEFAQNSLDWDEEKSKLLVRLWSAMSQGYSMLSEKALKNINRFLEHGLKYSDAVLLAKIPEIVNLDDKQIKDLVKIYCEEIKHSIDTSKLVNSITNSLIANYKSTIIDYRRGYKDHSYKLQDYDFEEILNCVINTIGEVSWNNLDDDQKSLLVEGVSEKYQDFFTSSKRDFIQIPSLYDVLKDFLKKTYPDIDEKKWDKLYHPSQIAIYNVDKSQKGLRLGSPNIGAMRNPVARRTLNILRRKINALLDEGVITPEDTRIVIETTRQLNDANMRWAIDYYQKQREAENKKIREAIEEYYPNRIVSEKDVDSARYIVEQSGELTYKGDDKKVSRYSIDVTKYKLWLEQGGICLYTGKIINISNLFNDNAFDIEHTIPRSKSFDNSDMNLTICDAFYNTTIKKNQLPTQLQNYEHDAIIDGILYTAIKPRLEAWEKRVERLKRNVEFWKTQTKRAQDKKRKDDCIRQKHLWNMELDYWQNKLSRFKMTEVKEGFRNSQLVDTGIITKYATLYLKSIFNNVEVQKGGDTAIYRKMLGIQSIDEKKNRDKHSHHAIDAAVLTAIPVASKKKRMLDLFYKIEEGEKLANDMSYLKRELADEIKDCNLGTDVASIVEYIEKNILINHITKDQTMTPSHKKIKARGKDVMVINSNGKIVNKWSAGDSIRGRIHQETYYGAIKLPENDENGNAKIDNGKFVYDENETITMVVRVDIKTFENEKDLDKIVDNRVRNVIKDTIKKRTENDCSFKDAINQDIWMIDKNGNEIRYDKNGRPLSPIRHVRCKVAAGRGFMTREKSIAIRKQINKSSRGLLNIDNRDYKEYVYAQNDSNYLYLLYEGIRKGGVDRKSKIINLYEASLIHKENPGVDIERIIRKDEAYNKIIDKKVEYKLTAIIKVGYRVLLWNESPEEIYELDQEELSKRLFVVGKFNTTSSDRLYLRNHLNSSNDFDIELVSNKFNALIEYRDFEIDVLGNIIFYD